MSDAPAVLQDDWSASGEQAEQIDEPVTRRHEERDVVQAVAIHAPDERAEDLETGSDGHAHPHLQALLLRRLERRKIEHYEREQAKRPLLPQRRDAAVGEQQERRVRKQVGMKPVRLEASDQDYRMVAAASGDSTAARSRQVRARRVPRVTRISMSTI